jgi:hypothetical protein
MEAKLTELVDRLKVAAGSNLKAVVLYGSGASGQFRPGHSDLNILCLVERAGTSELEAFHATAEWWIHDGNHPPLIFTREELDRSADVFAIELLDMKSHHRILYGEDFFAGLEVPTRHHGLQVERELRTNWLRLRQAIVAAPLNDKAHFTIMSKSVSTFCALFRHALLIFGESAPTTKRDAVAAIAAVVRANPAAFYAILDAREGTSKTTTNVKGLLSGYLEFVEIVTREVDRRLDTA